MDISGNTRPGNFMGKEMPLDAFTIKADNADSLHKVTISSWEHSPKTLGQEQWGEHIQKDSSDSFGHSFPCSPSS